MARFEVEPYDIVGIGFGPANIGLAVALEESGWGGRTLFLERRPTPDWQSGMLLDGTDIQHHPLRDFVTPRNPLSPYGFLNFLKCEGRLFQFLNLDIAFPLRKDYAAYVRWVADQFDRWVRYGQDVIDIRFEKNGDVRKPMIIIRLSGGETIRARTLSLATGRTPAVPGSFQRLVGDRVVHFSDYLPSLARWREQGCVRSIAVIGGSQSAIEITLDLARYHPPFQVHNIHRGFGYQLKDTSPFTEEIYFPDFVDAFYHSKGPRQQQLWRELRRSNYGSADHDVIQRLYTQLYEQRLDGDKRISLHTNCEVAAAEEGSGLTFDLTLRDLYSGAERMLDVDAIVLATGFKNFGLGDDEEPYHPLLRNVAQFAACRPGGDISVSRDYRIRAAEGDRLLPIFLNGLCESSHGFGDAGSFSLLSQRAQMIADSIFTILNVNAHDSQSLAVGLDRPVPREKENANV
jgi:L-ornithine N5-monooxygenase